MSYDSLKATAVVAIAKAKASAALAQQKTQDAEDAQSQAVVDATAAQSAVFAIQPDPVVPPTPVPPVITPDGYVTGTLTDKNLIVWSIVNGQIAINGTVNGATSTVSKLYAKAGVCYFVNAAGNWYIPNPQGGPSTQTADPTAPVVVPPVTPPASGNGFALAQTAPPGYTGKIGAPLLATDCKTIDILTDPLFFPARDDGADWSGPFNSGEQEIFTHEMVDGDGDVWWISNANNDTSHLVNGVKLPYKSGCFTTRDGAASHIWGEGTLLQARVCFMPGPNNWQAGGGYGADHGYPRECDWFELTDQLLQLNKHYPNSSGGNAETGQRGWGPSTIRDGKFHILGLEWLPGKLTTYFDGVKQIVMTCPTDSEKYTLCFNNAIRGTANLGRTMGVDWVVISPVTSPGA